jgi:hypothetical protein
MGLLRGMARTAVVAGTATAVSNRVSRRQAGRWGAQEQEAAEQQQVDAGPQPPPPPTAPAPTSQADMIEQLQKLGELKSSGVLTEAEFATQKARVLAG